MDQIFFAGWNSLLRTLIVGVLAYVGLVVLLRLSGNRTLSKLNAFDLVVTVALGSTLATILLSKDVALAQGLVAFALLIGMQFAVTWSSVRLPWVAEPENRRGTRRFRGGATPKTPIHRGRTPRGMASAASHAHRSGGRPRWVKRVVTGEPTLLLHRGELLPQAMRRTRVTEDELQAALRGAGLAAAADAEAVVLETDGSISVVRGGRPGP